ncbi:MAG: hypothetical protein WED10_11810 [Brumimicrobium sp.]
MLAIFSCRNYARIDYDKNFEHERKQINDIVILPIVFYEFDSNEDLKNSESKEKELLESMDLAFTNLNKKVIYTDSFKSNKVPEYLNHLVPLQKDIIRSSDLHQDPYMFSFDDKKMTRKFFVQTPKIQPDYLDFSEKYNTPYVIFIGIFSNKGKSFHYIILADIEKSEIIYRRLNFINKKITRSNLYPVVYNSLIEIFNE